MSDTYDLLPELSLELGDVFKPELEQILLFHKGEQVFFRLVFSKHAGITSEDEDLSFVAGESGPLFTTDYSLETNAMLFLELDSLSLLMVIGDAFTEDGVNQLLNP